MAVTGQREPLISWRRACFVLLAIQFLTFVYLSLPVSFQRAAAAAEPPIPTKADRPPFGDATIDYENVDGLTDAECSAEFPDLYTELDRSVDYWRAAGHKITRDDIDITNVHLAGVMRILIHNNEIRILESKLAVEIMKSQPDRAMGMLHLFQRALSTATALGEQLPTVELSLSFDDNTQLPDVEGDTHTLLAPARTIANHTYDRLWIMPNFDFWFTPTTGAFLDSKRDAMQHDRPFVKKKQQLVWRGWVPFNPELRGGLVAAAADKPWADVAQSSDENHIRIDEFCLWAMTVYTEGTNYSGRLKYLLNCASLLFSPDSLYLTHYSHLLIDSGPQQNYVRVERDWSDLEEKVTYYLDHPDEADEIINNALATFRSRYTTRAATSCYLRRLIRRYAEVAEPPKIYAHTGDNRGHHLRGWSYERFMFDPHDLNYEELGY